MDREARLAQLRAEYLALSERLIMLRSKLDKAQSRTRRLEALTEKVNAGLPLPDEAYQELDIRVRGSGQSPNHLLLKYRLDGLLREAEREEGRLTESIGSTERAAAELEVCPECGGRGTVRTKLEYESLEGGIVVPRTEEERCELCDGTGKLPLLRRSELC